MLTFAAACRLAADSCIYAIPCNAKHVLKINVRTEEVWRPA